MATPKEMAQQLNDLLQYGLDHQTAAGVARMPADQVAEAQSMVEDALLSYEKLQAPHDERHLETSGRLIQLVAAINGWQPASVNVDSMFTDALTAARSLRDAARVPADADLNALLAEIAAGAEARAGKAFGKTSRFAVLQTERDAIAQELADANATLVELNARLVEKDEQLNRALTDLAAAQGADDRLLSVIRNATFIPFNGTAQSDGWFIDDATRTAALGV